MNRPYDKQEFYRAHLTRDIRFDGKFFVAVKTTKIYCRPVCPARKAKLENLEFFIHAAQAEEAGYRPCLRCRPETAPGSAAWIGTSATIRRAVRMMESLDLDSMSIKIIAEKLGIGERWLRELFQQQIGINPQAFLLNRKLNVARNLLDNSDLSTTEIALSSGFNSIRRFNDAFKTRFQQTPSSFKKKPSTSNLQSLYLRYRPPFSWKAMMSFFSQRAIPAMESVTNYTYQRLFTYKGVPGWMKASLVEDYKIKVDFKLNEITTMLDFVTRVKELFDLDADPMLIENDLKRDKKLKPLLKQHAGLRIPGCWDGFELAVRAVIGQKISVKAARTVLIRLVDLYGEKQVFDDSLQLTYLFPSPEKILSADLLKLGLTTAKAQTLKVLAQAVYDKELILDSTADYEETCKKLLSIKGIGPWTVEYIAMRGLKNPDAFPETDLEIKKRIKQFDLDPQKWIPWRAYAAILLFNL
ncbi:MAG: hypothetical protein A3E87_10940 [Gammaproteobacteria bacterium RIFCSPHIGHO2_12_FULL_35_23]|nr:MAG: hypothetical protein A3E87_10940 [Gammaproteobacteria bacterium RIFCSPHIGHO2_12_FULL_35_23]